MGMPRQIRPWLWSALLVSILGAVAGAMIALVAMQTLSARATALGQFERVWGEAVQQDQMASLTALRVLAMEGEAVDERMAFEEVNRSRGQLFLDAIVLAPEIEDGLLTRVYLAVQHKSAIEEAAVAYAMIGNHASARSMLSGGGYRQAERGRAALLASARQLVSDELARQTGQARLLLGGAITILASCTLAACFCWLKVGGLFRRQAVDLEAAHQTLAEHANALETRIQARTRDLEAAKVAAEAADRTKSAFLAQMSHEIRTPLNGVLGMADALAASALDTRQARMVGVIRESGTTLLALLNDVLDLSKIEAGRVELETTSYSVADIVRSAEAIFTTRAHQKGISLAVALEPAADIWCLGDPTRVRQVLYNLISNAVKFTPTGGVRVTVRAADGAAPGRLRLVYEVADTGIGIDREARERLFQRFTQAGARTNRHYGGTGLGLAISRDLARLMEGDVVYAPADGPGSVFTFHLDAVRSDPPARTDAETFGQGFEDVGQTSADLRVLAAEDNAHNRLVLQLMLEQVGIVPVFAETGRMALQLWEAQTFDIILMDIQMPEMGGIEATRLIRSAETAAGRSRTPVIALTANAMTHHVQECLDAGMDAHVAKPILPELLFAAIDAALEATAGAAAPAAAGPHGALAVPV